MKKTITWVGATAAVFLIPDATLLKIQNYGNITMERLVDFVPGT